MKFVIICSLSFIAFFAHAQRCNSLSDLSQFYGSWESKLQTQLITESWHKVSDFTLEGVGETYVEGKLKSSESLRIVAMSNALFYIAKVDHNPLPVAFELVKCTNDNVVFENLNHDFPKRIEYKFSATDQMTVTVSDGKEKGFALNFIRANTKKR